MKKPSFFYKIPLPVIWIIVHGAVFLALGISALLFKPVRINTNFFDILPSSHALKAVAQADKALSDKNSRQAVVLAASSDFSAARQAACELERSLSGDGAFESIMLFTDARMIHSFSDFLYEYRFALLDDNTRGLLESGKAPEIAEYALASAYSAFNFSSLDYLEGDPFFLTERELLGALAASLAAAPSMSVRENVLAARLENTWFVMLRLSLSQRGVGLTNKESAVKKIYDACGTISSEFSGNGDLRFVYSGAPFHSYESSSGAQREISVISLVTSLIVIILFLVCFRNIIPIAASFCAAALSVLAALSSALLFFREVHVLTFVFGTTLIGTCVDYSIHYFMHWKWNSSIQSSAGVRSLVFRGITMSLISSCVCFIFLFFTPFAILRQFAVFLTSGLLSSYLTVNCIFPLFAKPVSPPPKIFMPFRSLPRRVKACILAAIAAVFAVMLFINRHNLSIENNIRSLYTMQGKLLESEITAAAVMNTGSVPWYYLVSGKSPDETLENEEILRKALDEHFALGNKGNYTAVSRFIPSVKTQKKNISAAEKLLPLAQAQYSALGFNANEAELFADDLANARYVSIEALNQLPAFVREIVSSFWIGQNIDGLYYSAVLVQHASAGTEDAFREIALKFDNVFFINKVRDIGSELDRLTKIIALLFIVSYVIIAIIVRVNYSLKKTLRICLVPVFLALVSITVLTCLNIPLGFFPAVGLILVFGLGLDYIFYITENEINTGTASAEGGFLTDSAIFLSYATTALSFGALALSGFVPVKLFGLTVLAGLSAAYIAAMLAAGKNDK